MEEKLLFKNTSRFGKEELEAFQNLAIKRMSLFTSIVVFVLCGGAGAGFCFLNMVLGLSLVVAGLLGAIIMPYVIKETVKKQNSEIYKNNKYLNNFEFYENKILIKNEVASNGSDLFEPKSTDTLNYSDIDHAVVYGVYIYIFINKYQSLILNQKGMTEGVAADLIEYFKTKGIRVDYKKEFIKKK